MKLKVLSTTFPTSDSVTLTFEKPATDFNYQAGQHANIRFRLNDVEVIRTYSFSSSPTIDHNLAITVRSVKDGLVSNFVRTNSIDELEINEVNGSFSITPGDRSRHLIMIAGGSGITPIISMIRTILNHELQSRITLIYSNRSYDHIIFRHEIQKLAVQHYDRFQVLHVITQQEDGPADFPVYFRGRLSKLILKKTLKTILSDTFLHREFYVCGPAGFMQVAQETLESLGVDDQNIHREIFFSAESPDALINLPAQEIILNLQDGEQLLEVGTGQSILQAALSKNMRLAHSCTQGQCGVCRAKLISGQIKMAKNYALAQDELQASVILLCQSYPLTDNVTVRPLNHP